MERQGLDQQGWQSMQERPREHSSALVGHHTRILFALIKFLSNFYSDDVVGHTYFIYFLLSGSISWPDWLESMQYENLQYGQSSVASEQDPTVQGLVQAVASLTSLVAGQMF
jgi:hypothetical protein